MDENLKARALKRKEVRALKQKGLTPQLVTASNMEEMMDEVFTIVFGSVEALDELPNDRALALFKEIMDLSYGMGEAKNS